MNYLTLSLLIAGIAIVLGLIVWLLIVIFKEKEEDYDKPRFYNFMSHRAEGRAYGDIIDMEQSLDDKRVIVHYEPKDINPKKVTKEDLEPVKVIIDKTRLIVIPKGIWSNDKTIIIGLPKNVSDFPTSLKEHEFGKMLMLYVAIKDADNAEIESLRIGSQRKTEILNRIGDGEVSNEHLDTIESLLKESIKAVSSDIKKPKPFDYKPPSHPGGF